MNSKATYLVISQAFLFVVFLLISFFFNRFSVDDYYFIGEINSKSFSEIYSQLYFEWHGRWTANFTILSFLKLYHIPYFLLVFNLTSVSLLLLAVIRLFKHVNSFFSLNLSKKTIRIYSTIFLSIFFFCTISPNQTWFWYTASLVYLWGSIAIILSLTLLLIKNPNRLDYILFGTGLIYVGGAYEPLAIMTILFFIVLIYKSYKRKLVAIGLIILLAAFLINYLSPGTAYRERITPGLGLLSWILYSGYNTVKYLFFNFHFTYQIAIVLSIPFYILGKQSNYSNSGFNPTKEVILSILLIGFFAFLNQSIAVFALGGLAPDRAGIITSLFIALAIARLFFLLGNYSKSTKKIVYFAPIWGCLYLIVLNIYYFDIHKDYSAAVDKRNKEIIEIKSNPIIVEPLPESGYLYNTEITTDPDNFKNQHLKHGLGLKNDVVLNSN